MTPARPLARAPNRRPAWPRPCGRPFLSCAKAGCGWPAFSGIMVEAYARANGPFTEKIRHRADRHWELRELTGLPLSTAADDDEELAECVAKLKAGPILS